MVTAKEKEAIGTAFLLAMQSRFVIALLGLTVGGAGNAYLTGKRTDPRIDSIMVDVREIKPVVSLIQPLQDTVKHLDQRVTRIEDRDARMAYLPPRNRTIGRSFER